MKNTITIKVEVCDEEFFKLTKDYDKPVNLSNLLKGREGIITSVSKEKNHVYGPCHRPIDMELGEGKIEIVA